MKYIHKEIRSQMSPKKSQRGRPPKKYTNGVEKADRLYGIRFNENQIHTKNRIIKTAEIKEKPINDFLIEDVFKFYFTKHFEDIGLSDFKRIFSKLEEIPQIRPIIRSYKKRPMIREPSFFNLPPVTPLNMLIDADIIIFNSLNLDKKILYKTWGEFLVDNQIISTDMRVNEFSVDFIARFNRIGRACAHYLRQGVVYLDKESYYDEGLDLLSEEEDLEEKDFSKVNKREDSFLRFNQLIWGDGAIPLVSDKFEIPWESLPIMKLLNGENVEGFRLNESEIIKQTYFRQSQIFELYGILYMWDSNRDTLFELRALSRGLTDLKPHVFEKLDDFLTKELKLREEEEIEETFQELRCLFHELIQELKK